MKPTVAIQPNPGKHGRKAHHIAPYLAAMGAILCWASLAAVLGEGLRDIRPEVVLFYALLVAGLSLGAVAIARAGRHAFAWPGWRAALYGVYGIWGYHTLLVLSFSLAPDVEANVLNYTWTLWIVLLGSLLPGNRFSFRILAGALLGFTGVVLVIGQPALRSGALPGGAFLFDRRLAGLALALGAGLCWGSFTAFMRWMVPPQRGNMALFCLLAALAAGIFMLGRGAAPVLPPGRGWLVAYLGLVPMGLSFVLWEKAAKGCNVMVLGFLSFLTPVLSTLLLALVSGEKVGVALALGLGLILAGAALGGHALRRP